MPGDRFAFAVLVRCENEFVGIFHQRLEFADLGALIGVNHIERLKALFNIDALFGPGDSLIFLRDIGGALGQVADMADRCLHNVFVPQEAANFARLRRGLNDD